MRLETRKASGLTTSEARRRQAAGLGNRVAPPSGLSYAQIVGRNALTPINAILFAVSAVLALLGLVLDALVTAGPVLIYVAVAIAQEAHAKRQLDAIALLAQPQACVIRDGRPWWLPLEEVVLGDRVELRAGDEVPLDGRVVDGQLEVDESLVTGESDYLVRGPGDRLLSGSVVGAGAATYLVDRLGGDSYAGQLVREARRFRDEATPLQREVGRVMVVVAGLVLLAAVPVAATLLLHGEPLSSTSSLRAAAVLVAIVPQGLAMMIALTYSVAALRLARAGALVQRLGGVEAISRLNVLVCDKTGTITAGGMELREVRLLAGEERAAEIRRALRTYAGSARAANRTVEAIGRALGTEAEVVLDEVPFRSDRRWSAIRVGPAARTWLLGAPDRLAETAGTRAATWQPTVRQMAARGLRVLLFAEAPGAQSLRRGGEPRLPPVLMPLALLGLAEPIRADAPETLRSFSDAGVELRVLSGDDPVTVGAIARSAGIEVATASDGRAVGLLDDGALERALPAALVVGRAEPAFKARVVDALRRLGRIVGMLGDGVNDLPALKRAQVSVAMGSGSPAARGVSDLVLLDDDFGLLPRAVVEGRRIVTGMVTATHVLLARTGAMVVIVTATSLLGAPFPFTPRTNAILALVTVGIPIVFLALWARPCVPRASMLADVARFTVPVSVAVGATGVAVFLAFGDRPLDQARTALVTVAVFCGLAVLTLVPGDATGPSVARARTWLLAAAMAVAFGVVLAWPLARASFELQLLSLSDFGILVAVGVAWAGLAHAVARLRRNHVFRRSDAAPAPGATISTRPGRSSRGNPASRHPTSRSTS